MTCSEAVLGASEEVLLELHSRVKNLHPFNVDIVKEAVGEGGQLAAVEHEEVDPIMLETLEGIAEHLVVTDVLARGNSLNVTGDFARQFNALAWVDVLTARARGVVRSGLCGRRVGRRRPPGSRRCRGRGRHCRRGSRAPRGSRRRRCSGRGTPCRRRSGCSCSRGARGARTSKHW